MNEINSVKDLIVACSGEDEDGNSKSYINIFLEKWKIDGTSETIDEYQSNTSIVHIFKQGGYVIVDLDFKSKHSTDLNIIWRIIQNFMKPENSVDDEGEEIPTIVLSIVPEEYKDQYYILCVNPILPTLQPALPTEEPCVIRMAFNEDDFKCYTKDDSEESDEDVEGE